MLVTYILKIIYPNYLKMNIKKPVNTLNGKKSKEIIMNLTHTVSIKVFKNSHNITKPFTKPISKIF